MKISKVVAIDSKTKAKQTFLFGTAMDGKDVVLTGGSKLNDYLEFVFNEDGVCPCDVEAYFEINQEEYVLRRTNQGGSTTHGVLEKKTDGNWKVVAYTKAVEYIEGLIHEQLADMLKIDCVTSKAVADFHGDLKLFDQVRMLAEVQDSVIQSTNMARNLKENALRKVENFARDTQTGATVADLNTVNAELEEVTRNIAVATAQLGELKAKHTVGNICGDINKELEATQQKYNILTSRQAEFEEIRSKIKQRDDVAALIPRVKTMRSVAEQKAEYEKMRYSLTSDLEWQENELKSVTTQLEEKQRQYTLSQDKRNRIDAINAELAYIQSLHEKNKSLNETLLELNEKQEQLTSEKVMYANKLDNVEKSITDVKASLDAFNIPAKSVGELLETVRVDIKIDEVTAQIDKLQSEIAVKESQIAEKESNLVVQVKRFRSIAELDVAVTPIKAKDTILQVLDAKYSKLEAINISLQEKLRNLERACEDYKYRITQLDQSKSKLKAEQANTLEVKQEEFKREVFLANQQMFDDATAVVAVTTDFHDENTEALEHEISTREMDRDLLLERAYQLEGSIKEIKRHIEINNAEMSTLQREKANINNRYDQLVSQNRSEAVFNYLKALNNDNGTQYLLDVQQEAVRSEAELTEIKRNTEGLRANLASLKSRLKYLQDTQSQLDGSRVSVDSLVTTNDKLKDNLTDIGERLSAGYEQYKAISHQLESIESKLGEVRSSIVEITKTVKVNEQQIADSTEKAKKFAGSDDVEQAVANFKYDMGDVESEYQMLAESKKSVEQEVFKKRLELEKTQWLYDTKSQEYDTIYSELQLELNVKGLDIDKIESMNIDNNYDSERKSLAEYDTEKATLAAKIDNLYGILQNQEGGGASMDEVDVKQKEITTLQNRQRDLEEQRKVQLSSYVSASNARMAATAAAAEARTLENLKATLDSNAIISLLIEDKIKAMLATATQYLNAFTDGNYVINAKDFKVTVSNAGKTQVYDDLTENLKTAVYVSVILSVPNTDVSDGKWLVFDEHLSVDNASLSNMMLNIANVCYVVNYEKE